MEKIKLTTSIKLNCVMMLVSDWFTSGKTTGVIGKILNLHSLNSWLEDQTVMSFMQENAPSIT
jgi:hypothetical protein